MSVHFHAHPLVMFIHQTFGEPFAALLLAGHEAEEGSHEILLRAPALAKGKSERGLALEISGNLPRGQEPLVLAALLRLLLTKAPFSAELEFELPEALSLLGWPETARSRSEIDRIIRKYLGLSYTLRREGSGSAELGMSALLIGYDRDDEIRPLGQVLRRSALRVQFHPRFVAALKGSRVIFAGIDFGPLRLSR